MTLVTVPPLFASGTQSHRVPVHFHTSPATQAAAESRISVPTIAIGLLAVKFPTSSTPSAKPGGTPLSFDQSTGFVEALIVPTVPSASTCVASANAVGPSPPSRSTDVPGAIFPVVIAPSATSVFPTHPAHARSAAVPPPVASLSTPSAIPAGTFLSCVQSTRLDTALIVPDAWSAVMRASSSVWVAGSKESFAGVTAPSASLTVTTAPSASLAAVTAPSASAPAPSVTGTWPGARQPVGRP